MAEFIHSGIKDNFSSMDSGIRSINLLLNHDLLLTSLLDVLDCVIVIFTEKLFLQNLVSIFSSACRAVKSISWRLSCSSQFLNLFFLTNSISLIKLLHGRGKSFSINSVFLIEPIPPVSKLVLHLVAREDLF